MAIVVGIDEFISECRTLTNLCGNGVARCRGSTAKTFGTAESMALHSRTSLHWVAVLRARREQPPQRGHQHRSERVLDQRCRDKRHNADQPGLVDAELHTERQPGKPGPEN